MHRFVKIAILAPMLAASAARCAPIRTTIENDTGAPLEVEIRSKSGDSIAHGKIPAQTGLDLEERFEVIGNITYRYYDKECVLSYPELESRRIPAEPDTVYLVRC